jgi:hypothetical protein
MSVINKQLPISGSLPNDYQEVLYWSVTEKPMRVVTMNILGVFLFFIFGLIFSNVAVGLGKLPLAGGINLGLREMIFVLMGIILTLALHELIHGLTMSLFGASPKYGIIWKGMMLYATSPGYAYSRNNYVIIALAPFILISILVVLGMWGLQGTLWVALLGICGVINASGAIGDMWITAIVLRYPATAYVMDERDGARVFSLAPPARAGVPKP